jgi:hypothetical protein
VSFTLMEGLSQYQDGNFLGIECVIATENGVKIHDAQPTQRHASTSLRTLRRKSHMSGTPTKGLSVGLEGGARHRGESRESALEFGLGRRPRPGHQFRRVNLPPSANIEHPCLHRASTGRDIRRMCHRTALLLPSRFPFAPAKHAWGLCSINCSHR